MIRSPLHPPASQRVRGSTKFARVVRDYKGAESEGNVYITDLNL